jgi:hypothetical protein
MRWMMQRENGCCLQREKKGTNPEKERGKKERDEACNEGYCINQRKRPIQLVQGEGREGEEGGVGMKINSSQQ